MYRNKRDNKGELEAYRIVDCLLWEEWRSDQIGHSQNNLKVCALFGGCSFKELGEVTVRMGFVGFQKRTYLEWHKGMSWEGR